MLCPMLCGMAIVIALAVAVAVAVTKSMVVATPAMAITIHRKVYHVILNVTIFYGHLRMAINSSMASGGGSSGGGSGSEMVCVCRVCSTMPTHATPSHIELASHRHTPRQ